MSRGASQEGEGRTEYTPWVVHVVHDVSPSPGEKAVR